MRGIIRLIIFSGFYFFCIYNCAGQDKNNHAQNIQFFKENKQDTNLVNACYELANEFIISNTDSALVFIKKGLSVIDKTSWPNNMKVDKKAIFKGLMARAYYYLGNIPESISKYDEAVKDVEHTKNLRLKAGLLDNSGIIYNEKGDYVTSLERHLKALSIFESLKDTTKILSSYINTGRLFKNSGDFEKAEVYYRKVLNLTDKFSKPLIRATAYNNLATLYNDTQDKHKIALEYLFEALKIREKEGADPDQIASTLGNIGNTYQDMKQYNEALKWHLKALEIREKLDDVQGRIVVYNNIGNLYLSMNKLNEAKVYAQKALDISVKMDHYEMMMHSYRLLSDVFEKSGDLKNAFRNFKLYIQYKDSIINEEQKDAMTRKDMQYTFDKKQLADSMENAKLQQVKNLEIASQKAMLQQEKTQRYALYGGLLLVLVFSGFIYNRFKITQKQKLIIEEQKHQVDQANEELHQQNEEIAAQRDEIEQQKHLVEIKQKEIIDSITYARRIQRALLTNDVYLKKHLNKRKN